MMAAVDLQPGDKVEVVRKKRIQGVEYFGQTGTVKSVGMPGNPHEVSVAFDHPVHAVLGPAVVPADILKKVGSAEPTANAESLYHSIRPGDRVTIVDRFGKEHTGRAVMKGPAGWVLNMGGPHGTPDIASPENITKVKSMGAKQNAWGIG